MPAVEINYLAVLVSGALFMIIGSVWYSPVLFAGPWQKITGINEQTAKKGAGKAMTMAIVASLVAAFVLAHFVDYTEADTFAEGLQTGAWAWLGFSATTMAMNYAFQIKPFKLFLIDASYFLLGLALSGGILAIWV